MPCGRKSLCRGPDLNRHGRYRPTDFKSVVSTIPPPRQRWEINRLGNVSCSHNAFWDTVGTLDLPFCVLLVSLQLWRETPMATIERRNGTYRVKVRRKGA